jgi:hypothetical protein
MYQVLFSTRRIALKAIATIAIGISKDNPLDKINDCSSPLHSTPIRTYVTANYIKRGIHPYFTSLYDV